MSETTGENVGLGAEGKIEGDDDVVGHNGGQSLKIKLDMEKVDESNCEKNVKECQNEKAQEDHKRKKTRRARRARSSRAKRKPYSKSWQEKDEHNDMAREDASIARAKMFSYGLPEAPYNTTQFLMDDHNDLQDLDVKLQAATTNSDPQNIGFSLVQKPPRARDSSFSMDSDDDYFYSSPSDEEEFLTREFANTYEDLHAERLGTLSKSQLIQDYVQLEGKVDLLEKRLKKIKEQSTSNSDAEVDGEVSTESESQKNVAFQQQMNILVIENERLTRENERLRLMCSKVPSTSSVDSESDSTDSSCSSSSDSDNKESTTTNESKTLVKA